MEWGAAVRHGGQASARGHGKTVNRQVLAVQREEERGSADRPDPRPAVGATDDTEELYRRIIWRQKSERGASPPARSDHPVRSDHTSSSSDDVPTDLCCPCLPLSGPASTPASLPSRGHTEEADIEYGSYADFAHCHTHLLDTVADCFAQGVFPAEWEQRLFPAEWEQRQAAAEERSAPLHPGWLPTEWEQRVSRRPDVPGAVVALPATPDQGKRNETVPPLLRETSVPPQDVDRATLPHLPSVSACASSGYLV